MINLYLTSPNSRTKLEYIINSLYISSVEVRMYPLLYRLESREYDVTILVLDGYSIDLV